MSDANPPEEPELERAAHRVSIEPAKETSAAQALAFEFKPLLNDIRLAVLGILVTVGLSVGFGVEASWYWQLLAGAASFGAACFLVWWRPSRRRLMSFAHRLTGE